MDYIILDIEFNGRKFASDLPMEVIEIGAVRLDAKLVYKDEFSALIKPQYYAKLNSFIKKKTGIPQEGIDQAKRFPVVIGEFLSWLSQSEACILLTWGGEDLKRIVLDTRMHKLDDAYWMNTDYFDLLKGYLRHKGLKNDVSVEAALQELGIEADGAAHRALDDARMTAEIFRRIYEELDLSMKQRYKDQFSNAKERRLVRTAIQSITAQKIKPEWSLVLDHFLNGKIALEDARKLDELRQYYETEVAK